MATANDVAAAVVRRTGPIDTFKLQKLVYYCQAWHLVWDNAPLFDDPVQAWAAGPVIRSVYENHRGRYSVTEWPSGDPGALTRSERATVDAVVGSYGGLTGRQLSHLTHNEQPWKDARDGLAPTDRSNTEITLESLYAYYSALDDAEGTETALVSDLTAH